MGEDLIRRLLSECRHEALHLEMRDSYDTNASAYRRWLDDGTVEVHAYADWSDLVRDTVGRGVRIRRSRIVSEPLSSYVSWEHAITDGVNISAGEEVRWLPRRAASSLLVPGSDCWVFDGRTLVFNHFGGDGLWIEDPPEVPIHDRVLVARMLAAFEEIWARSVDHKEYRPT
jgi:hypothetical protein